MKRGWWVKKFVMGFVAVVVLGTAFVLATQYLWNWLVPVLFAGPMITFWQTFGLLVLSKILFSGFGGKSHWSKQNGRGPYWKEKWNSMAPEEQERFKAKMKGMGNKWCSFDEKVKNTSAEESNTPVYKSPI